MHSTNHLFAAALIVAASAAYACSQPAGSSPADGGNSPSGDGADGGGTTTGEQGGGATHLPVGGGDAGGAPSAHLDYFADLPSGAEQFAGLCERDNHDAFFLWYCGQPTPPSIGGIDDLLAGAGLKDPGNPGQMRFVLTGHSSSLVARRTTSVNPRAIVFSQDIQNYEAVGFVRGDGFAEVAAFDPEEGGVSFYLVRTHLACEPNCTNADRYLPSVESGWQSVDVYYEDDLQNTPLDCLQCHQPAGADTGKILRMQERKDPWTHFFRDNRGSSVLLDQFLSAHPGESYGGIPADQISNSDPKELEDFVESEGFGAQPNEFKGNQINGDDPGVTTPNDVWNGLYANALQGKAISPPYFGISPFDPAAITSATEGYMTVAAGRADPSSMPDMAGVFLADALPYIGFLPAPGLDATQIVQHRCSGCHDGRFPGMSRDNFNVANFPAGLSPELKTKIKDRIHRPDTDHHRMPPKMFSDLRPEDIATIEQALQ